jgi:hypothetical protein
MPINTKKVLGRRQLRFETLDDVLHDAETLASKEVQMLGNWSLGQVFRHLSIGLNGSTNGFTFRMPYIETLFVRIFLKKRLLTRGFPSGYGRARIWDPVKPGETSTVEGLSVLQTASKRFTDNPTRFPHPLFGKLSPEEWYLFHLRHSELHLSFAKPVRI